MEKEQSPEMSSALQALALSEIEEGMGHNVTRAQGLQEEIAQRRASLLQDLAEAQALRGQEELLAEIVEEEMAHQQDLTLLYVQRELILYCSPNCVFSIIQAQITTKIGSIIQPYVPTE